SSYITEVNGSVTEMESGLTYTTYPVIDLPTGTYYYVVVAFNNEGNSTSNCIQINIALSVPGTISITSDAGTPDRDGAFILSWTAALQADNYTVYIHDAPITEINGSVGILTTTSTGTSYPQSGLLEGVYYYLVVAFNRIGNRSSNLYSVTVDFLPPGNFTLSSDAGIPYDADGAFTLNWTDAIGAINYSIYTYNSPIFQINGSVIEVATGVTALGYPINGMPNGTHYYLLVAFGIGGNTSSNCISIVVDLRPPEAFTLWSDAGTPMDHDGDFSLLWELAMGVSSFTVYNHTQPITEINGSLGVMAQGVLVTTLSVSCTANGTFYYIVVATNAYGNTSSNLISVIVSLDLPGTFTLGKSVDPANGSISLFWNSSDFAAEYFIYVHDSIITEINSSVTLVAPSLTGTSFNVYGFEDGTYYFVVVAVNEFGNRTSNCVEVIVTTTSEPQKTILDILLEYWYILVIGAVVVVIVGVLASRRKSKARTIPRKTSPEPRKGVESTQKGVASSWIDHQQPVGESHQPTSSTPVSPTRALPQVEKVEKFYCGKCAKSFEISNPNFLTWYSCPTCSEMLSYLASCPMCGQSLMISKEFYATNKGGDIACSSCQRSFKL
nr:hypothetical protein [Candidatus Sigynarchaeota archaeon]